jgi:hypothetical protein
MNLRGLPEQEEQEINLYTQYPHKFFCRLIRFSYTRIPDIRREYRFAHERLARCHKYRRLMNNRRE